MDPALRLMLGTAIVVVVGWVPFACFPSVSPATRDVLVRTALDEARYQCVTNPPNEARLQAACVALLGPDDSPVSGDGGPMNVEQGNATRRVDGGQ